MSQPEEYDPIKLPLWEEPELPLIAQEDTSTPLLYVCIQIYLTQSQQFILYFLKQKWCTKSQKTDFFTRKQTFSPKKQTKIRAKQARGLLNRPKSVKTLDQSVFYRPDKNGHFRQQKIIFIKKQTKIRAKWARGLLNRPKSVKTDRVNNTAKDKSQICL